MQQLIFVLSDHMIINGKGTGFFFCVLQTCFSTNKHYYRCLWSEDKRESRISRLVKENPAHKMPSGKLHLFGAGTYHLLAGAGPLDKPLDRPTLVPALAQTNVFSVGFGTAFGLCTTEDGMVYSWGDNTTGNLGLGDYKERATPTLVRALADQFCIGLSAAWSHAGFLVRPGKPLLCGSGDNGQLGNNKRSNLPNRDTKWDLEDCLKPRLAPEFKQRSVSQIACGESFSLFLTHSGQVFSCGEGPKGSLGLGQDSAVSASQPRCVVPSPITSLSIVPVVQLAAGSQHAVALSATGSVYVWGCGKKGQLGVGSTNNLWSPSLVPALDAVEIAAVSCGQYFTALLTRQGAIYTCGENSCGQLGLGSSSDAARDKLASTPQRVRALDGQVMVALSCGNTHMLALAHDGRLLGYSLCMLSRMHCAVLSIALLT
jgi:alpha-tubulin suppressor-like RCC1 family protein